MVRMDGILGRSFHIRDPFLKLMDLLLCIVILVLTSVQWPPYSGLIPLIMLLT